MCLCDIMAVTCVCNVIREQSLSAGCPLYTHDLHNHYWHHNESPKAHRGTHSQIKCRIKLQNKSVTFICCGCLQMASCTVGLEFSRRMIFSQILQFITYIVVWFAVSASGLWFFLTLRDILFKINVLLQLNPWAVRGIDRWGIFVFGIIWIVVVFVTEGYLRSAIAKNRLWKRIQRVLIILAVAAAILFSTQWVINFIT